MDLSKLSTADLQAIQSGDMSKVSDAGLQSLSGEAPPLWKTALNSLPKGAAGLVDSIGNAPFHVANLALAAGGALNNVVGHPEWSYPLFPTRNLANEALTGIGAIRPENEPTTPVGKAVDFAGQAIAGGGVNPAAAIRNLSRGAVLPVARDVTASALSGVGASIGQQAAQQVDTGSEAGNNALQIAASLTGGAVPGAAIAARGTGGDRTAAALKGVTPEQLKLAQALQDKARAQGSPITGYEAIQAITGLNPKMQTQQRIAEQSDAAAKTLTPIMQARPGANAMLAENAFGQIAPVNPRPDDLAGRLASTATTAISDARQAGNAKAAPYYATTTGNPNARIPAGDWATLTNDPLVLVALTKVKKDPVYGVTNAPEGSVAWLDAAKKWMDDQAGAASLAQKNNASRMYTAGTKDVTATADQHFPDYARARAIVADNMKRVVTPMQEGQVGKLSRSDEFGPQAAAFLPEKPLDVTPQVVGNTVKTLGAVDPEIVPQFLAQQLRGTFNESNGGGIAPNPMGGYQFAKKVADNPMQRANLVEALQASGKSPTPLIDSLDIFHAQGFKPTVNSATASNLAEGQALGSKSLLDAVSRPLGYAGKVSDAWRNGLASRQLAEALASPDSVRRLEEMARANGTYSPVKQQMLINLLLSQQNSATPPASQDTR